MPLLVDDIRNRISAMMPDKSDLRPLLVAVQDVVRDIRAHRSGGWSFDLEFGTIELVPSQEAGTVSINNGSTALTGVGTSFDSPDHTGYKISLGGVVYEIASQSSATAAVLTTNFAASANLSGETYTAYQNRYDLAADVGRLYRVWDQTNERPLTAEAMIRLQSALQVDRNSGQITHYAMDTRGATDLKRLAFRPYPTAVAKILYLYEKTHTQITAVDSDVDLPDEMYEVVVQGVYARMLGLLTNHSPQSLVEQQLFQKKMREAWKRDQDLGDFKVQFIRQDNAHARFIFPFRRRGLATNVEGP